MQWIDTNMGFYAAQQRQEVQQVVMDVFPFEIGSIAVVADDVINSSFSAFLWFWFANTAKQCLESKGIVDFDV